MSNLTEYWRWRPSSGQAHDVEDDGDLTFRSYSQPVQSPVGCDARYRWLLHGVTALIESWLPTGLEVTHRLILIGCAADQRNRFACGSNDGLGVAAVPAERNCSCSAVSVGALVPQFRRRRRHRRVVHL